MTASRPFTAGRFSLHFGRFTHALFEWRITRIRATPARLIGYVQAPDAEQAVKEAIAQYGIDNPQEQARLHSG